MLNFITLSATLFAVWLMLSGILSPLYLIVGFLCSILITYLYSLIYKDKTTITISFIFKMIKYSLWLLKEIFKSAVDVSLKMWQLEPEISPKLLWVTADCNSDIGNVIYANSITLTPGTVTIASKKNMLYVHCLTENYAKQLQKNNMLKLCKKLTAGK